MVEPKFLGVTLAVSHILIQTLLCIRAILRPHREPTSRIAWIIVIATIPVVGILAYLLFGEVNIGRRRVERFREVLTQLPSVNVKSGTGTDDLRARVPEHYAHLFRVGQSINGFEPVGGNHAQLMQDSNSTIESICATIARSW